MSGQFQILFFSPSDPPEIPMVLVQGIDIFNLYDKMKSCWLKNTCDVGVAPTNDSIPDDFKKVISYF